MEKNLFVVTHNDNPSCIVRTFWPESINPDFISKENLLQMVETLVESNQLLKKYISLLEEENNF